MRSERITKNAPRMPFWAKFPPLFFFFFFFFFFLSRSARPCTMFVTMTQGYVWALRKVGYRAPQPKSPIGIRSGISDYVGPGSTRENFSSTGLLCSSLAIPNITGCVPVYFLFFFFFGGVHALPHRSDCHTDFYRSWVKRCVLVYGSAFWGLEL